MLVPVHRGNIVKPREAAAAPTVEFPSAESGLWTLVMTGLDSHLQSEDKQVNSIKELKIFLDQTAKFRGHFYLIYVCCSTCTGW